MTEPLLTIDHILRSGIAQLNQSDTPKLDSEILLLKVLNDNNNKSEKIYTKTWLLTWPEKTLSKKQVQQFEHYIELRSQGMPVSYITGTKDFWSFTLDVTSDTLIPRPETELLVECALEKISAHQNSHILDLGTGSGAIALAIASEMRLSNVLATDFSLEALNVAQNNAIRLGLKNISFCQSHWFKNISEQNFDLIISNPPYIAENDPHLDENVRSYEPLSALLSKDNGLADINEIIIHSQHYLKSGGWLLFEHGYTQAEAVQNLFRENKFCQISSLNDLNQFPRVTLAQRI
ncbi:MAG: peptide chain release factor N(5)-glutamine methyltransferase [Gammaproteobacteria bacterium]|nr:peptide chain release factor N(5)-glutamine methyltransferase [Gammaproteobacteria bacterium]